MIAVARFEVSRTNFGKAPDTYGYLCELHDDIRPGPRVLAELFFIAVTRFEVFQINWVSRTKNQPKEEVLGTDIPRTYGGHSRGHPGPKLRSGRSKSWKKTSIWPLTSMTRRRGRPRP